MISHVITIPTWKGQPWSFPKAPLSLFANRLYLSLLAMFYIIPNRLFLVYHLRMINYFLRHRKVFSRKGRSEHLNHVQKRSQKSHSQKPKHAHGTATLLFECKVQKVVSCPWHWNEVEKKSFHACGAVTFFLWQACWRWHRSQWIS